MARFDSGALNPSVSSSAFTPSVRSNYYDYYNSLLQVKSSIKQGTAALIDKRQIAEWSKSLAEARAMEINGDIEGAWRVYQKVSEEKMKLYGDKLASGNLSDVQQAQLEAKVQIEQNTIDTKRNAFQGKIEIKAGKDKMKELKDNVDAFQTSVQLLQDDWFNRKELIDKNGNPQGAITGEDFDNTLYQKLHGEGGMFDYLNSIMEDANLLGSDAPAIQKVVDFAQTTFKKFRELEDGAIKDFETGASISKTDPLYNLKDRYNNPQNYKDFINASDPRKLYRGQNNPGATYSLPNGTFIDLGDSSRKGTDPNVAGWLERKLVDPNNPNQFIYVYFDPYGQSPPQTLTTVKEATNKAQAETRAKNWDASTYQPRVSPNYSFRDIKTGIPYVAENGQFRQRTAQDDILDPITKLSKFGSYEESLPVNPDDLRILYKEAPVEQNQSIEPSKISPIVATFPMQSQEIQGSPLQTMNPSNQTSLQGGGNFLKTSPNFLQGSSPLLQSNYGLPKNRSISF